MMNKLKDIDVNQLKIKLKSILKKDNAKDIINKTIFGMDKSAMIRHYLFATALLSFLIYINFFKYMTSILDIIFIFVSFLLYPFARATYQFTIDYILGDYIIFNNIIILFIAKIITMTLCLLFSIILAPFGLIILYILNSKNQS